MTKGVFGKVPIVAAFSLANYANGFVSGMQNGSILVWKGTSATKPYKEHNMAVTGLCDTEKGGIISGDAEGNIVIWNSSLAVERKISVTKMMTKSPSNQPKVIALCSKG